jgi:hypothetical protein
VETPRCIPAAEVERMMKVQDILLKAMAKKITWWEAADQWLGDERWYDLIAILDDATSEIYDAQLVAEEFTPDGDGRAQRGDRNQGAISVHSGLPKEGVFIGIRPARS